mmetsp:Transcript_52813/g.140993  ORF Transcript_52813/g.140993 Transcript_52813/m.140993 type:complete len:337 (+) Transcript_52813:485-1495(+)
MPSRSSSHRRSSRLPRTPKNADNSLWAQCHGGFSENSSSSSVSLAMYPPRHVYTTSRSSESHPAATRTPSMISSWSSVMKSLRCSAHLGSLAGTPRSGPSLHWGPTSRYRSSKNLSMCVTSTTASAWADTVLCKNSLASDRTFRPALTTHTSVMPLGIQPCAHIRRRPMSFRYTHSPSPKPGVSTRYTARSCSSPSGCNSKVISSVRHSGLSPARKWCKPYTSFSKVLFPTSGAPPTTNSRVRESRSLCNRRSSRTSSTGIVMLFLFSCGMSGMTFSRAAAGRLLNLGTPSSEPGGRGNSKADWTFGSPSSKPPAKATKAMSLAKMSTRCAGPASK